MGRILIADDEETFLRSTGDLLRRAGYECDCAPDGTTAEKFLQAEAYDVLIADIKMPGNLELQLVQDLPRLAQGLPVILVTGYPSLHSAIRAIDLPVAAYLVKPLDFNELLTRVRSSIERSQIYRTICQAQQRLDDWRQELDALETVAQPVRGDVSHVPIHTFLTLTLRNVFDALRDLKQLADLLVAQPAELDACHLLQCPRPVALMEALKDTIQVLEKTKSAFKSKDLGELRRKLEAIVASDSR